jgi:tetratricopeptide (TPR) repeat protein
LGAGGLLGAFGPFLLTGNFVFSAVGLPAGMVSMIFVYLVWQACIDRVPDVSDSDRDGVPAVSHSIGPQLALIGVFAALVGHFIEVHFVFSIAATYVYFWVFAGVVAAWASGVFNPKPDLPLADTAAAAVGPEDRPAAPPAVVSRRHRRRQRPAGTGEEGGTGAWGGRVTPAEDWETWLGVSGLVMAIILVGMVYDFVTSQFDVTRGNYSVLWMFSITWGIGIAVGLGEVAVRARSWQKPIRWGRAVLLFVITSLGYTVFYLLIHTWQLHPGPITAADPIQAAFDSAKIVNGILNLFYVFVALLLGLIAAMLAVPLFQRQPRWRIANWWLYPVLILPVGIAILFKNVDVVRADTVLKQGEQYRNQGQYDGAIALGKYSVELDSDEDFYYLMLALAYQLKAQDSRITPEARTAAWADGERVATRAREINPYNPDNTGNMGRYYLTWAQATPAEDPQRAPRFQLAISYFGKAIQLAPQNVIYYNLLGQTYYVLGQFEQAVSTLQQSAALDAQFDQTQMLLGDTYGAMGRPQDAIQAHRTAILLNPAAFADQFLDQRINFYLSYPQIQEIVTAFKGAMVQRPKDVLIPRTLGHIYSRMGDHQNAIVYYEQAIAMGDTDLQTLLGVGVEYVTVADYQKAEAVYQRVVEIDPNNVQAHSNLAYALARLGRFDEAIQENQRVLQIAPNDYISHRNLVLLYRDAGRLDEALQQAQQMIQTTPQNELGPTYLLVGSLYEVAGKPTEAITAYEKAVSAAPGLAQAQMALGNLYLQQGRAEDALRTFQALAQLTPDDYAVHQHLALTYRQLKRWDEALAEAQLAVSKAPADQQPAMQQLMAQLQTEKAQGQ